MSLIESIVLGIIQGLTEFLPVSSSGHLEIAKALFGDDSIPEESLLFSVVVHAATALSTIVIFRNTIWDLIKELFRFDWNEGTQYLFKIGVSIVPVGIVGVLFEDQIESFFNGQIMLVGFMLLVTGALLLFTTKAPSKEGKVTFGKAIIIGLAQAIAILPGISRSGATISTGLLLGVEKSKAARFSFLMVLVPILGATALKMKDYLETPATDGSIAGLTLLIGFLAAFISGLLACQWMISLVKKGKLIYFAIYCFAVGSIAVIWSII